MQYPVPAAPESPAPPSSQSVFKTAPAPHEASQDENSALLNINSELINSKAIITFYIFF